MRILAALVGLFLIAVVLTDAFNTLVLARCTQHVFRLARYYYRLTWSPFSGLAMRIPSNKRREGTLAVYGQLSLIALFALWAITLIFAFGLVQWAAEMQPAAMEGTFGDDVYLSACALVSLSSGDPQNTLSRFIAMTEGGLGLGFLGLVVGYLPVLYQSFAERELRISLLDAVAGSPPTAGALLEYSPLAAERFEQELNHWEEWSAQTLEQHLSFPMLAYFRSQHPNQSWLTALVAIVDCAAVMSLCAKDDLHRQSDLTFAMGSHVIADMASVFRLKGAQDVRGQLSAADFAALRKILAGSPTLFDPARLTEEALAGRRRLYEPHAAALSRYLLMALPSWMPDGSNRRDWRVSAVGSGELPYTVSDPFAESK